MGLENFKYKKIFTELKNIKIDNHNISEIERLEKNIGLEKIHKYTDEHKYYFYDIRAIDVKAGKFFSMILDNENNVWISGIFKNNIFKKLDHKAKYINVDLDSIVLIDISDYLIFYDVTMDREDNLILKKLKISSKFKAKMACVSRQRYLFIDMDNDVWIYGPNDDGQLGLGHTKSIKTPVKIPNIKAKFICNIGESSFIIDMDNNILVFGDNNSNNLGLSIDNRQSVITTPTKITKWYQSDHEMPSPTFKNLKAKYISMSDLHTLIIDMDDNVLICGDISGAKFGLSDEMLKNPIIKSEIIDDENILEEDTIGMDPSELIEKSVQLHIPVKIPNIKAKFVFAHNNFSYIINTNNELLVFGYSDNFSLGLNMGLVFRMPTLIPNIKVKTISCSDNHSIAIKMIE